MDIGRLREADLLFGYHPINPDYSADFSKVSLPKSFCQVICDLRVFSSVAKEIAEVVDEGGDDEGLVFVDKYIGIEGAAPQSRKFQLSEEDGVPFARRLLESIQRFP